MRLGEIINILSAKPLNEFNRARDAEYGFETALLSDVLAHAKPGTTLILTEITNPQVVRTAEMVEAAGIIFVKGKTPDPDALRIAREMGIPLIETKLGMFEACGKLYAAGLQPARKVE